MLNNHLTSNQKKLLPWLAIALVLLFTAAQLHDQGRMWICSCGQIYLWVSDVWSSDNSQHLSDPYSFSHVLHGFIFFWLLVWSLPKLALAWQLGLAITIEAGWEIIENSAFVIQRYREATAALGYQGDTVINSLGDILACGLGFMIVYYIGIRRSVLLFVVTELVLLFWIKDGLLLNVLMLLYPIEGIKAWQLGQ